jgi:hypothetical protein
MLFGRKVKIERQLKPLSLSSAKHQVRRVLLGVGDIGKARDMLEVLGKGKKCLKLKPLGPPPT